MPLIVLTTFLIVNIQKWVKIDILNCKIIVKQPSETKITHFLAGVYQNYHSKSHETDCADCNVLQNRKLKR